MEPAAVRRSGRGQLRRHLRGLGGTEVVLPDGLPAAERTYAFSCTVVESGSGSGATTFVLAAPPEAVHARLYGSGGEVAAEADLDDGVAVLPADQTIGQRPAVAVEAFTADGTTLLRTPVPGAERRGR